MTTAATATVAVWEPPASVRVRGTLAVVAGADESARVYERFARRLAFDGYVVGVHEAADAASAARWLAAAEAAPRVLVGADIGGAAVLALAAQGAAVDGVIVAGVAVGTQAAAPPSQRTACPVHLGVLADDASRAAATPSAAPIAAGELDVAVLGRVAVPVLVVHGDADAVTPLARAVALAGAIPVHEIVATGGGLHDALNDVSHRSVAATIVLWLERLRSAGVDHPVVRPVRAAEGSAA